MNIRPFIPTDEEYAAIVAVHNAAWPQDPKTVASNKHHDTTREAQYFYERHVVEVDGVIVAEVTVGHTFWSFRPNKYFIEWSTLPEHAATLDEKILHHFEALLIARGATQIQVDAREDRPEKALTLANGYKNLMREAVSHLVIADFDIAPYSELDAHLHKQGISIYTAAELEAQEPDSWAAKLEEASWTMFQDVPSTDTFTRPSLQHWLDQFKSPTRSKETYFVAVTEARDYIGLTRLETSPGHKMYTGLTSVKRTWRRKGIATALKVAAIRYAKTTDFTVIETDNEENNPMYDLNMQLGFKPQPAWLEMHKVLE